MARPGYVRQPGAAIAARVSAAPAQGTALTLDLPAGLPLLEAVRRALARTGHDSGVVDLRDLALGPFGYVMPALAENGRHAAFYSPVFRPAGMTRLAAGAMTFGLRDQSPFFHAHALWREQDGKQGGGHLLPEETLLAEPAQVEALALTGATFTWRLDPEINFTVPGPAAASAPGHDRTAHALRVHPNVDLHRAIEDYCVRHAIAHARIRGGVGSTIGALFDDGREVTNFATEVFIERGSIAPGTNGLPVATIDVGLIDFSGRVERGRLQRGANPVLMTFELALEVTGVSTR
ncbi:MAG TPA: DUF296 domain-containing protein [Beijerinckiaceae bacterium]|nr:DUF296 domain-containing protein [Beijerinckiaceae bacterium]